MKSLILFIGLSVFLYAADMIEGTLRTNYNLDIKVGYIEKKNILFINTKDGCVLFSRPESFSLKEGSGGIFANVNFFYFVRNCKGVKDEFEGVLLEGTSTGLTMLPCKDKFCAKKMYPVLILQKD